MLVRGSPKTAQLLVIGYGNELRSDDGVGPKIANEVAKWKLPGVQTLACQQLTPELADPIASAARVVFVDAAIGTSGPVQLLHIGPEEIYQVMTHATNPRALLGLARRAFGRCPPATWLTIPVEDVDFGEELSPLARNGFVSALEQIRLLTSAATSKV
jgi:hydrogenase maturation protease